MQAVQQDFSSGWKRAKKRKDPVTYYLLLS